MSRANEAGGKGYNVEIGGMLSHILVVYKGGAS
jgi:hypothetical protein